ncbi:MAG: TonB-dependent receptor, partial [Gammaproteobacteria bacterium TMED92]
MSKIESNWSNPTGLFALVGLLFAGLLPANVALAADEEVAIEEVVVTGSRIKRTGLETASPISVFTSADIEASGLTTIEDFIQNIPSINGAYTGASVNNGNPGLATAGLRGLGAGRTLTLMNGRRFNSNDLNSIPTSFIERVEIVRDGASTIYGSDAIAGVINFITKTDFEGLDVNLQYDVTGEGDGETSKFSVVTGASSDRGNVVVSVDYVKRNAIGQGDRSYSECPIWEQSDGTKYCGGSSHSHFGRVNVPAVNNLGVDAGSYVIIDGQAVPFSTADHGFNYAALSYLVTPQEVFSMNGSSRYDITDNIRVIAEAGYTSR